MVLLGLYSVRTEHNIQTYKNIMTFTIDTDLIENDEVRLTENSSDNLEITHIPSGTSLEIDAGGSVSTFGKSDEEIQDAVGNIVTGGIVYDDASNTISLSQDVGSVSEESGEYNLSDDSNNKIFRVIKSTGDIQTTGELTEGKTL